MTPDPDGDETGGANSDRQASPAADQTPADSDSHSAAAEDRQPETAADRQPEPDGGAARASRQTGRPEYVEAADEMDWRGWLLVGLVFVCFLVIPVTILFLPAAQGFIESLGLSLRQTYLALPMIPAILLGVTAVWAALRTQRTRKP